MAATLAQQVAVDRTGPDEFESRTNPGRMGNTKNIAYGGCAIANAIHAAFQTVPPGYLPYTVMGNYLGPALTDRKLLCSVRRLRDTRTFATRQVYLSQEMDDGSVRMCMSVLADFQVREKASMYEYSAPPRIKYSPVEQCEPADKLAERMVAEGRLSSELVKLGAVMFGMKNRFMESRFLPEGVAGQNLQGLVKTRTTQDDLHVTDKTSADWTRVRHPLPLLADKFAALGFIMDEALSFLPLTHDGRPLYDSAACSSLDFAIRFFTPDLDLTRWSLREFETIAARDGRTYSESRMWDAEGNMLASMTQQSIMRPKPGQAMAKL